MSEPKDHSSPSPQGGTLLVIGQNGQLAVSLGKLGSPRIKLVGRPTVDFDQPETVDTVINALQPAAVINAAAWTAVDLAESEPEAAARANRDGPQKLAALCAARNIPFIHVSTDYVFDGEKGAPYVESDPISPRTVYGRTKAEGEQAVMAANPRSIILRTSWVYSATGKNFVRTMLHAGARNPTLHVVGDQKGNPTSADDLARVILGILGTVEQTGWNSAYAGLYHACGTGDATWYDLAVHTLQEAERYGQPMPQITAITTLDWPTPAPRPADSRMDTGKLQQVFGLTLPNWKTSVNKVVHALCQNKQDQ